MVAQELGYDEVPVVYVSIPDVAKEKELNLRLNKNNGDWDFDLLGGLDKDILELVGFEQDDIGRAFPPIADEHEDDVPAAPEKPKSKTGDIYVMGEHRVMCGDSTKSEDVDRLMNGKRADMVFTDPPYGVSIGKKNRMLNSFQKSGRNLKDIADDDLKPDDLYKVLLAAFTNLKSVLSDCSTVFVSAPQGGGLGMMMMMMKDSGLEVRHVLIWKKNKPTFSMGRLDYDYQHEPILLAWNKSHKFYGGGICKTSIWEFDSPRESKEHPTMKPVALVENAILNNSKRGDIVADIFLGSGTTLIACEKTQRVCYGIEKDPSYVDLIVKRWEDFTGKKAVLSK